MRFDGVQSAGAGHKFDYNAGTIKRKEDDEDPIKKAVSAGANAIKNIGNFLAQGITNPAAADNSSSSATAFRQ